MEVAEFERLAHEALESLPDQFKSRMENVLVVVEEVPSEATARKMVLGKGARLLGLYEGVPLSRRGTWYGAFPVEPDRITLFKRNIEYDAAAHSRGVGETIRDVLIHEIAHHFGMNEEEIRNAGY